MHYKGSCWLFAVLFLLIIKLADLAPVINDEKKLSTSMMNFSPRNNKRLSAEVDFYTVLASDENIVFNEMFDNITNHFVDYSDFLKNAPTVEILLLRLKVLKGYRDPTDYSSAEAKFDRFVLDFRSQQSQVFDKFAFSTMDFLIFPDLGVRDYTANELARIRSDVIKTIPRDVTGTERTDFIAVIDAIISTFPNGKNLAPYFKKTSNNKPSNF